MKYALVTGKPVPKRLEAELLELGFGKDITLSSGLRTQDAVEWARSQGAVLMSQQELFDAFQRDPATFNPANPPGQSTHELRNDGVAFPGPARMPLRYYQMGVDCLRSGGSAVSTIRARAANKGWTFTLTYPGNPREGHHGNFRKEPILKIFKPLTRGSRGPRVARMTKSLGYLGFLRGEGSDGTGKFDKKVEEALKHFQHDYFLADDGVCGLHTHRQLVAAVKGRKRCRKNALKFHGEAQEKALEKCSEKYGPSKRRGDGD